MIVIKINLKLIFVVNKRVGEFKNFKSNFYIYFVILNYGRVWG